MRVVASRNLQLQTPAAVQNKIQSINYEVDEQKNMLLLINLSLRDLATVVNRHQTTLRRDLADGSGCD